MLNRLRWMVLSLLLPLLVSAELDLRAGDAEDNGDAPPPPPPPKNALLEPTPEQQKEELAFLHSLEASVNTGDGSAYDQAMDMPALIRQAGKGLSLTSAELTEVTDAVKKNFNLGSTISQLVKTNQGNFKFLQVRTVGKERRALFRMMPTSASLNYQDLVLSKDAKNHYRIADIYVFMSGEMMSATFRRSLAPGIAQNKPEAKKLLSPTEVAAFEHLKDIQSMLQLRSAGKFPEAWKTFQALPAALQEDKSVLLIALVISQKIGETEYVAMIKKFGQLFPDNPALDLINLDAYFIAKNHEKILECLDQLDKRVGPDAMLLVHRANCLMEMDKSDEAAKVIQKAIDTENGFEQAYYVQIVLAMKQKKFDLVAQSMTAFEKNLAKPYGDISANPLFKDFLASDAGKKWTADHAK